MANCLRRDSCALRGRFCAVCNGEYHVMVFVASEPPQQDCVQFNKPSFKKQCKGTAFSFPPQSRIVGKLLSLFLAIVLVTPKRDMTTCRIPTTNSRSYPTHNRHIFESTSQEYRYDFASISCLLHRTLLGPTFFHPTFAHPKRKV